MLTFIVAFAVALTVTALVVRTAKLHGHPWSDRDFSKPQKFHAVSVPRVGGVGVVLGMLAGIGALAAMSGMQAAAVPFALIACALPAFAAGFVHDLSEALSPRGRLLATAVSAALAFFWLDAAVLRTEIPGIDTLLTLAAGSFVITLIAVAGIANSINIIDGFNGLAGMCVVLMLSAVAYVAFQLGDGLVGALALAAIGAVLGFFLWNFPAGLIFLGDGGAYFLGFMLAELNILLVQRNPGEVSPLFPLLVCIYPVFETLFSIYRRSFLRAVPPSMPDGIHLHSLIYRRVLRWAVGDRSAKALTRRNSRTSPFLWMLCSLSVVPAVLFYNHTSLIAAALTVFAIAYVVLYWRIVRFKAPRWMRALAFGTSSVGGLPGEDNQLR